MGSILDESTTWVEFGKRHLDRRISKAITSTLGLERPTLVQSQGIPVALAGKDLLCRARTGSGKTLCYGVPLVQRMLKEVDANGSSTPLSGVVLVPTKELIVQVHGVVSSLLTFAFDVLTVEPLLSGQKYMKAELPTMLVTTPSSLMALLKQRQKSMVPLAKTLKVLIIDEADLMFSFGYEGDMRALCGCMPTTYQAMLVSATLSEEVEQLKGLMLHKPVTLKLEEPRVSGKLSQFYFVCRKDDRYLVLYTLLKLQLVQGKILLFVGSIDAAYRIRILLERFSINSAVLNSELPHATRQNIIQAFNQGVVELLIATDDGVGAQADSDAEEEQAPSKAKGVLKKPASAQAAEAGEDEEEDEEDDMEGEEEEEGGEAEEQDEEEGEVEAEEQEQEEEDEEEEEEEVEEAPAKKQKKAKEAQRRKFGERRRPQADQQYSLTRGVDLQGVTTVINVEVPKTVRSYVHRVGRCARGGASGTALTLCAEEEEPMLQRIMRTQASADGLGELKPLPLQISDAERFRYRVEDMARGLTKKAISRYRARELQLEALNSEKLKAYFEDHPEDRKALQKTQRQFRERKSVRQHLKNVPSYLMPENLTATTPVQQALREEQAAQGGPARTSATKRRQMLRATKSDDPLQGFKPSGGKWKRMDRFTREAMIAKDRRINPKTANVEELPPLSGRKLWKLRHGKKCRRKDHVAGERKRLTIGQRKRQKKFGHL